MQKGEMQRTALLCIDSYDAGVPTGTSMYPAFTK